MIPAESIGHTLISGIKNYPARAAFLLLLGLSLITRFVILGHPSSAVFDEVHFNYFAGFYYTGQYYYDIHPPLGKLIIALSALPFGGIAPEDVIREISTPYPSDLYIAMRTLPALFGSCLPLLIFLIARELKIGVMSAFIAGLMAVADNALLIQSRLILLDAMLLCFGLSALWTFLIARRTGHLKYWGLSAFFAGLSISIKWIGVSFLGLIGLVIIIDWARALWKQGWHSRPFFIGSAYLLISLSCYTLIFLIHFSLLPLSHKQGDPFMSINFQSTLEGSRYYKAKGTINTVSCPQNYKHALKFGMPDTEVKAAENVACQIQYTSVSQLGFWRKFFELNRSMYVTNQGLAKTHPDASKWYMWPMMQKPLYYWYKDGARIYLMGNPVVWWLCALGIIVLLLGQLKFVQWRQNEAFWVLMTGFWANLLPFAMVNRVMFMYHYLTSLCFSILLFAYLLHVLKLPKYVKPAIAVIAICSFLMISPLTYGLNWYGSDLMWFLRFFGWHP